MPRTDVTLPAHQTRLVLVESYRAAGDPVSPFDPIAVIGPTSGEAEHPDDGNAPPPGVVDWGPVRVLGAVVIPGDEVVFYLVHARSVTDVRRAFEARGIGNLRMVTAAWVAVGPGRPGTGHARPSRVHPTRRRAPRPPPADPG
ncbi:MAG: hypothetical protein L0227_07820 [Chloroflexi bacterium]|nr:hypothetical protein [Chloroflexota bacterium]